MMNNSQRNTKANTHKGRQNNNGANASGSNRYTPILSASYPHPHQRQQKQHQLRAYAAQREAQRAQAILKLQQAAKQITGSNSDQSTIARPSLDLQQQPPRAALQHQARSEQPQPTQPARAEIRSVTLSSPRLERTM